MGSLRKVVKVLPGTIVKKGAIRLIIVEEDDEHRDRLFEHLSREGFAVEAFANGDDSLLASLDPNDDIVLLGSVLPTASGADLLSRLYRAGINPFVVYLDGDLRLMHERKALERGNGLTNSAHDVETLARSLRLVIDAIRPEAGVHGGKSIVRGDLLLRLDTAQAFWKGVDVRLTPAEFRIVQLLALNFGRYLPYDAIHQHGHSEREFAMSDPRTRRTSVRSAMKRIRTKLRHCNSSFNEIESYAAFGYRWGHQG